MSKNKNKTEVMMTERQMQEAKEAKSVKRMTFTFVVIIILCAAIFAGSLLAQYKGSANINDGRGAIVIGLAAIFIGLSVSLKIKPNFVVSLIGVFGGGIAYYIVYNVVILMGLNTDYLKMLSAIIVALFLAIPYLKSEYFTKQKDLHAPASSQTGGPGHA